MSATNFKRCENCGAVRDSNDTFCGTCGKPFSISPSGNSYTTLRSANLQTSNSTIDSNTSQRFYTPIAPTQPVNPPQPPPSSRRNRVYLTIIATLVFLLIVSGFFIGIQVGKSNTPGTAINTPGTTHKAGTAAPGNDPTVAAITTTPVSALSPTPTQTITVGTIICKSDKSTNWARWPIGGAWKVLNGELLYDGTGNGAQLVAPASCQPTTSNYAVDVKMRIVSGCCHFGIIVRGNASSNGYTGYQVSIYTTTYQNLGINTLGGQGGAAAGYNFDNNFHDWRAYVKDNVINFVIDGSKVLSLTDNTYLSPGEVSICCTDTMQLDIASFQITAV